MVKGLAGFTKGPYTDIFKQKRCVFLKQYRNSFWFDIT